MQGYYDVVVNSGGSPIDGASVFIYDANGVLATIYQSTAPIAEIVLASNSTPYFISQQLVSPQTNPITTGPDGKYIFFAADGVYTVVISAPGYNNKTFTVTLNDEQPYPNPAYSIFSTPPNDAVNVTSIGANVSTTNGDLALVPKGAGALLGMIPDGSTNGNKRGAYSTDWQRQTLLNDYVASGDYAVVGGGYTNRASGLYSTVAGGYVCSATGDYSAVAGGYGNLASGSWAFAAGSANEASGNQSAIGGGTGNVASGLRSTICGGASNVASGNYSTVVGGTGGTTRGVVGYTAIPASDSPIQNKAGVSQSGILVLGVQTTNATGTKVRSNTNAAGTTNQLILANNSAVYFKGTVIANVTGGGDTKSWTFDGQIKRGANAAATTMTSTISVVYADAGASTWTVAIAADTTNGGLAVTVTGQASTTIRWVCKIETTEVAY